MSELASRIWRTKLLPMKPQPPVTRRVGMVTPCTNPSTRLPAPRLPLVFGKHPAQVAAVGTRSVSRRQALELRHVDEPLAQRDLLQAGDLQPLPVLQGL